MVWCDLATTGPSCSVSRSSPAVWCGRGEAPATEHRLAPAANNYSCLRCKHAACVVRSCSSLAAVARVHRQERADAEVVRCTTHTPWWVNAQPRLDTLCTEHHAHVSLNNRTRREELQKKLTQENVETTHQQCGTQKKKNPNRGFKYGTPTPDLSAHGVSAIPTPQLLQHQTPQLVSRRASSADSHAETLLEGLTHSAETSRNTQSCLAPDTGKQLRLAHNLKGAHTSASSSWADELSGYLPSRSCTPCCEEYESPAKPAAESRRHTTHQTGRKIEEQDTDKCARRMQSDSWTSANSMKIACRDTLSVKMQGA